jgi:hypothetical protein
MSIYANPTRLYQGSLSLFAAAKANGNLSVNFDFGCGGANGTWYDNPFQEIQGIPAPVHKEIVGICNPAERTIEGPEPLLYTAIKDSIRAAWKQRAFHLVFHSSGWDSRIISAAIRELANELGDDWLGRGLLFLGNRWESGGFIEIMKAQGWPMTSYVAFQVGDKDEHFAYGVDDIWKAAPCPIPGNLWQYLPKWAVANKLMPENDVQVFCGLWANEAWECFLEDQNPWLYRATKWYGYNTMASLPVQAEWVEYPLVSLEVLNLIRQIKGDFSGKTLREAVAHYACPEAKHIPNQGLDDRWHPLGSTLRKRLNEYYKSTYFGSRVNWLTPTDSNFSTEWGRWSIALLIEKLRAESVNVR